MIRDIALGLGSVVAIVAGRKMVKEGVEKVLRNQDHPTKHEGVNKIIIGTGASVTGAAVLALVANTVASTLLDTDE